MTSADRPALQPKMISRSLPMALLRARELFMSRFRPMLARHDVSEQQWRVLRVLNEERQLDASEVARRAAILAPSLTRIIKTLTARQLIESGQYDRDGRRVLLTITPAGLKLIREILPESLAIYAEFDARFGSDKIEQLLNLLEDLLATPMESAAADEATAGARARRSAPP